MVSRSWLLTTIVGFGFVVEICAGEEVTWAFTGAATSVQLTQPPLVDAVHVGSPLSGQISFDRLTQDFYPNDPRNGAYLLGSPGLSFTLGSFHSENDSIVMPAVIRISDGGGVGPLPVDSLLFDAGLQHGASRMEITMDLIDADGAIFSSDELPAFPPSLGPLEVARFRVSLFGGDFVESDLTSLTAVPEPASCTFVALGVFALLFRQWPFRRRLGKTGSGVLVRLSLTPANA